MQRGERRAGAELLAGRLLLGALGGLVGTAAMTVAMRRLHRHLPVHQRYALPPREIIEKTLTSSAAEKLSELPRQHATLAAHFGYGAASGALFGAAAPVGGAVTGAGYGIAVWAASYLGWLPAAGILEPASRHPLPRNALMLLAHAVWGAVLAQTVRELRAAEREAFCGRESPDAEPR